jgi:hypothetical protein
MVPGLSRDSLSKAPAGSGFHVASIVIARLADFLRKPVSEQVALRGRLLEALGQSLEGVPADARIVLEVPEGTGVVALGDPRLALAIARRLKARELPGCKIGLNHGQMRIVAGDNGEPWLGGDGVAAAMAMQGFDAPGGFFVSRAFRDTLAERDPPEARTFRRAGVYTDEKLRAHEMFVPDERARDFHRRYDRAAVALLALLLAGMGYLARPFVASLRTVQPAVIEFDSRLRGQVFVDGRPKGLAQALARLEIAPGPHTIEVRDPPGPPLRLEIVLDSGEQMTLQHVVAKPERREGLLDRARKAMGLSR